MLAVLLPRPADPLVAAGHLAHREVEQQAAQLAPLAVQHEVAQVRADRLAVAQGVVAIHPGVPFPHLPATVGQRQAHRAPGRQRPLDGGLGRGARAGLDRLLRAAPALLARRRQGEQAEVLQLRERVQGRPQAVVAAGCLQAQLLAHGERQFRATQQREGLDDIENPGDLLAGEALTAEGGRFEAGDAGVHGLAATPPLQIRGNLSRPSRKKDLAGAYLISDQ